jgi:hypothetical protein
MQSPFKIFRKHQKIILAGLVLMAMLAFGIGDIALRMGRSRGINTGSPTVVETSIGKLSQMEMNQLVQRRKIVQQFLITAFSVTHPELAKSPWFASRFVYPRIVRYGFSGESHQEVFNTWLQLQEANKMGIVVTDEDVEAFLRQFTSLPEFPERKLTKKKFFEALHRLPMQLSPKQLYDMLRDELAAKLAMRTKLPPSLPSPEKYWEYYQQLNTRQRIVAAALPVKDFAEQVPDPSESQINDFFAKHREQAEFAGGGEFKPGFRQPRRVNLQYLTLSYAAVEEEARAAGPITDKEIEQYYEEKKGIDRDLFDMSPPKADDSTPIEPDFSPEPPPLPGEEDEADASKKPADQPEDLPPPEEGSSDNCGGASSAPDETEEKQNARPAEGDAAPAEGTSPKEEADRSDAADDKAAEPDADSDEPAAPAGDQPVITPGEPKKKKTPEVNLRYKPLTDELREIIREKLIAQRVSALIRERTDKARGEMVDAGAKLSASGDTKPGSEQSARLVRRAEEALRQIAENHGMKFAETALVSQIELSERPGIGKAVESGLSESLIGDATLVQLAFADTRLRTTFKAENLVTRDVYLGWKVQDVSSHVPKLTDPGVREQVAAAWKRVEGLSLARKRAEELATRARESGKSFEESFAEQTVTGDPRGSAVLVSHESNEFSFWRESTAPDPRALAPRLELSEPEGVNNPGRKFMQIVFDQIAEGEVGVAPNDDSSVYYIVKVIERRPADREAFKNAPLFGTISPYAQLADDDLQSLFVQYNRHLHDKYAVKWYDVSGDEASSSFYYDDEE